MLINSHTLSVDLIFEMKYTTLALLATFSSCCAIYFIGLKHQALHGLIPVTDLNMLC